MTNPPGSGKPISPEDFEKLREAVRELLAPVKTPAPGKFTQEDLGREAGVSQSLISKFVGGGQIGRTSANRLAHVLRNRIRDFQWGDTDRDASVFGYCGSTRCPSLRLGLVDGIIYVAPHFRRLTWSTRRDCPYCNSPVFCQCPNCRAPILEKLLSCPNCGEPYVGDPDWLDELPPEERAKTCELTNRINEQLRRHLGDRA
jgi:hypothetical protein